MKHLKLLFISLFFCSYCFGQIVSSSCTAPDSIVSKYIDDADRLALRRIYRDSLTYIDSVNIPKQYSNTVLNALIAVYNATSLPARDTVTTMYNIHSFPDYAMNVLYIDADSNLVWMKELHKGNLNTGNHTIDSLITSYGLTIYRYYTYLYSRHLVVFETDSNYNLPIITNGLDTIDGVSYAGPEHYSGDGNDITDSIYTDHIELIYSLGWGDCPAGCTARRYWKFNVYFDCSVEFVESYGVPLPITAISVIKQFSISITPNPFNDYLDIKGMKSNYEYFIYNMIGQELKQGQSSGNSILNLDWLQTGYYLLLIKTEKQLTTHKLVKR